MAVEIDFEISGLPEALDRMNGLPIEVKQKGMRFAMRKAANLVRDAAQANAERIDDPKTKQNIAANIAVRFNSKLAKRTDKIMFRVGVLGGSRRYANSAENRRKGRAGGSYTTAGDSKNPGGDTWYWRFVELGTAKAPAQPFLRPALRDNVDNATREAGVQLGRWLDRYFRRQRKAIKQRATKR